jgi:hypothetical protein
LWVEVQARFEDAFGDKEAARLRGILLDIAEDPRLDGNAAVKGSAAL